jgi:hypothetical protein
LLKLSSFFKEETDPLEITEEQKQKQEEIRLEKEKIQKE